MFSAASIWEVAIKASLGRKGFQSDARLLRRGLLDNDFIEVPVTAIHAVEVQHLQRLHGDPFDRLLIAQARVEGLTLVTADRQVAKYDGSILKV